MNKETEPAAVTQKLTEAAKADYPEAAEIRVSFPDLWELVDAFKRDELPLYVAGLPRSQEKAPADKFFGLSKAINRSLTTYRQYKLFEPWPQPVVPVAWDVGTNVGRVVEGGYLTVRLQPLGQAQVWCGEQEGVLWECYLHETRRSAMWQEELTRFWQAVEQDMGVRRIFTQPQEPTFAEGYQAFLTRLGYEPDGLFPHWWRKEA